MSMKAQERSPGTTGLDLRIKRAYEPASRSDGTRFLVERVWPRRVLRQEMAIEAWLRDAAPSTALREWLGNDRTRWTEYVRRYHRELDGNPLAWQNILAAARKGPVTLVYNVEHPARNTAAALKAYLDKLEARSAAR